MAFQLRIVSLIASATEIVCALGLRSLVVGRSHECDYPQDIVELPQCTAPKFPTDLTSAQIDRQVKAILEDALSVYKVDAALLDSLSPTHIITQDQCHVCAVSLKDVQQAACQLIHSKPQIVSLNPNRLEDVLQDVLLVARALSVPERGEQLVSSIKGRLAEIRGSGTGASGLSSSYSPTVAFIEWIEPLMAGGNWMPELIEIAGGKDVFGKAGEHAPPMQWQRLLDADPQIIVVAPCGFGIERTMQEMPLLSAQPGWSRLTAVKNGCVFVADGNQYFNRPGPRLVDSTEILSDIISARPPRGRFLRFGN